MTVDHGFLAVVNHVHILLISQPSEAERERERASFWLEGFQATPARPSGRNNVKVKTLW
jgi:hypothetical protein